MARKLILQYMKQQNRPYSAIQVHDNLHGRVPKATVEKVLDTLSETADPESGVCTLRCKTYGKAKIFFFEQSQIPSFSDHEVSKVEASIEKLSAEHKEWDARYQTARRQAEALEAQPSDSDLDRVVQETLQRLGGKRERLQALSGPGGAVDPLGRHDL